MALCDRLFAVNDDMFCIFQGHIENIPFLKQQYGLTKTATEVTVVIEAYRALRDRGPYPADQVVRDFQGRFAFMLFDCTTKNVFLAAVSFDFFFSFFVFVLTYCSTEVWMFCRTQMVAFLYSGELMVKAISFFLMSLKPWRKVVVNHLRHSLKVTHKTFSYAYLILLGSKVHIWLYACIL